MESPPKPNLPFSFRALSLVGLLLGAFGAFYSLAAASPLLASRDQFVEAYRETAERELANYPATPPAPVPGSTLRPFSRDELMAIFGKQADLLYSRRGVALPLAAINFILSVLLFTGCVSARRRQIWGLQAWELAALGSLPYLILECGFALVQAHDLAALQGDASAPANLLSQVQVMLGLGKLTLETFYFAACLWLLRRAQVRALFSDAPRS